MNFNVGSAVLLKFLGAKYISRFLKMRELSFAQFVYFLRKVSLFFNFIIQKLKNKHTFLKKYTNWAKLSSLILTDQEETKTR